MRNLILSDDYAGCQTCDTELDPEELRDFVVQNDCIQECEICGGLLDYVISDNIIWD